MSAIKKKKIKLDEVEITYLEKEGKSSKTILCLHALGHSSKDYEKLFHHIEFASYRIIAMDFPGHGDSEKGLKPVSSTYFAEIGQLFINQLGLTQLHILGNSIGGAVAIRLATDNENDICSIQLANTAGLDKGGVTSKLFLSFMVWFFRKGVKNSPKFQKWFEYYYSKVLPSAEANERKKEIINNAYHIAPILVEGWNSFKCPSEDLRSLISSIQCPVLVTWAMKDKKVQYQRNIAAIKKIKKLQLIKYDIGHTPMLENSLIFMRDLKLFFDSTQQLAR